MVKQVIFDVGNVLMGFHTRELTARFAPDPADAAFLHQEIFLHPDWPRLDRGEEEAVVVEAMLGHIPDRLREAAGALLAVWDEALVPIGETNALAADLAELGVPLYILSNTPKRFYQFRERIPAWPLMRGAVLSCEERLLKPDLAIYRRLLDRFGLLAGDSFFIDDSYTNIEAARWCGMQGHFYRNDAAALRHALRRAGIPLPEEGERA